MWTPKTLKADYDRCLYGYDVRIEPPFTIERQEYLLKHGDIYEGRMVMLSVQLSFWPNLGILEGDLDGINLYQTPPQNLLKESCCLVALDVPRAYITDYEKISSKNVHKLLDESVLKEEYKFYGFDVVDSCLAYSYLYGFEWDKESFRRKMDACSVKTNCYDLIDSQEKALSLAIQATNEIPEHAPFLPCGVWIEKRFNKEPEARGKLDVFDRNPEILRMV
ncbi:MAG: hypothetical protein AB7S81_04000 [Bdellovibrionales bacterium]